MEQTDHREVARRLFTLASLRIEALTDASGAGQAGHLTAAQASGYANDLISAAQDLAALGDAIVLLAEQF